MFAKQKHGCLLGGKGWNVSNLSIERIEDPELFKRQEQTPSIWTQQETEETSGYLSLVFDGPEGGGSLQAVPANAHEA